MKKIILSLALIAGIFTLNIQAANTVSPITNIEITSDDDGFVDVKFEDLNEAVQEAVRALVQEYDLNALKFNAEKQLTKVEATKKDDQVQKTFYFDVEGKEVNMDEPAKEEAVEETVTQEEAPFIGNSFSVTQDDGFVDVKFEDLNEVVQNAVRGLVQEYDLNALKFNAEKQLTKVEATKKDDQVQKTFYFDVEGKEVNMDEPAKEEVVEETTTQEEAPSIEGSYSVSQDDGFVEVKLEDLNEKVQAVVNALAETHSIDYIGYNAEKQITKVQATNKADESKQEVYFDNEGTQVTCDKSEEVKQEETTEEQL